MASLFKKYWKKSISIDENRDSGFNTTSKYYLFVQDKWARKMERLTARLSKRKLVCLLGLFVVGAGGTCIYSILKPFFNRATDSIKISPISRPMDVIGKSIVLNPKSFLRSQKKFERITRFKMHLESLGRSPNGKRVFDSIDELRPGLKDSLVFIENYYKSNCKN